MSGMAWPVAVADQYDGCPFLAQQVRVPLGAQCGADVLARQVAERPGRYSRLRLGPAMPLVPEAVFTGASAGR
jgi:hypothetical protein